MSDRPAAARDILDSRHAAAAARFGFGAALLSGAGQTYFIGMSGSALRTEFGLDEAALGGLYALATLTSGMLMFWLGEVADRMPLKRAITIAIGVLIAGALLLSVSVQSWMLLPALLMLRLGGQGLAGHLAMVAAVRFGGSRAGRGASIAAFGFIAGEAVFPLALVAAFDQLDWRTVWIGIGALLMIGLVMLRIAAASLPPPAAASVPASGGQPHDARIGRRRLLRTPAFIAALAIVLVSAFVVTAVFLHQGTLAELRGWPVGLLPVAFIGFAATQAASNFAAGRMIDHAGVLPTTRLYLLPLAAGVLILAGVDGAAGLLLSFAAFGITAGAQGVVGGALWLQLFGPRQLGLIRGVYAAMMVIASAISPWLLGHALAAGFPLLMLAGGVAAYAVMVPLLVQPILRRAQAVAPSPAATDGDSRSC